MHARLVRNIVEGEDALKQKTSTGFCPLSGIHHPGTGCCRDDQVLQKRPRFTPPAPQPGGDHHDQVFLRNADDVLPALTDSGVGEDAVQILQPPLIAITRRVGSDRVRNPLLRDDCFAIPLTPVEIEVPIPVCCRALSIRWMAGVSRKNLSAWATLMPRTSTILAP
jgi:hypothetical protein